MSIFALEKMGFVLWEGLVLAWVILGSLAFIALRRKISGRPVFSHHDRNLLFHTPAPVSGASFCLRFGLAVLLFSPIGMIELALLAPMGAAILSVLLLLSCAGIVNFTLL